MHCYRRKILWNTLRQCSQCTILNAYHLLFHMAYETFMSSLPCHTGRHQRDVENQVKEVEDHLVYLRVAWMSGFSFSRRYSKDKPWIGKVLTVTDNEFQIHYCKGSYNKPWPPDMVKIRDGEVFLRKYRTLTFCRNVAFSSALFNSQKKVNWRNGKKVPSRRIRT